VFSSNNKNNLPEACEWLDTNLEPMMRKSTPPGISPPAALLPRHLDKPMHSKTSQMYADILKRQFSWVLMTTTTDAANNQPPQK